MICPNCGSKEGGLNMTFIIGIFIGIIVRPFFEWLINKKED
ncbi:MAG: hypothetical protein ACFFDF_00290 [Candidatus Odinarchaeota archaeon]